MSVPIDDAERAALQTYYDRTGDALEDFERLSKTKGAPDQSLKDIWTRMRSAGVLGRRGPMLLAAAEARAKIREVSALAETHEPHRRMMAAMMIDMGRPGFAADEALRHLPPDHPAPSTRNAAARLTRARTQLGALFTPINRFLEGAGSLKPLENADLGLIAPLHLIAQGNDGPNELPRTLLAMLSTTYDLAKAAGLNVSVIPDFIFASMERRPAHILSFHTAGQFPGFVHFKKADLPDYVVIDPHGYSGWSSLAGAKLNDLELPPLAEASQICDRLYRDAMIALSAEPTQADPEATVPPLPPRYVFVPLQGGLIDAADTVRFATRAMLQMLIDRFSGTDIAIVAKPHPKITNPGLIGWLIGKAEAGSILLREENIHTLTAGAEAVMTINSRVGSEVMIHRKPIYCFGGSDYDSIAHRITSAEQFKDLTTPIRPAVSENDLLKFMAYYRSQYLVDRSAPGRLETALRERVIDPILQAKKPSDDDWG